MMLSAVKGWFGRPTHAPVAAPPAVRSTAGTHIGLVRSVNEDRLFDRPDRGLWAVADGMGGHAGGDVAATIAVRALDDAANQPGEIAIRDVERALHDANREIFERFDRKGSSGTTIAGLLIDGDVAMVFWIGDSRVYLYRDGRLDLLTHDHSLVQEFVDADVLTPDQARAHPNAHVITRALGVAEAARLDVKSLPVTPDDRFLLCTDGLWGMLDHAAIATCLAGDDARAVADLAAAALEAGGRDNLAAVVVHVAPGDPHAVRSTRRRSPTPSSTATTAG